MTTRIRSGSLFRAWWVSSIRRLAGVALLVFVGLMGISAGTARAELQRVEAVGIYGIRDSMRTKVIPRDEAISRARWEGVSRVALELIGESGSGIDDSGQLDRDRQDSTLGQAGRNSASSKSRDARRNHESPTKDQAVVLESALGKDMLPYTRSYRILDDQGEKPVLFADLPGIKREYVVVVEVIVDVDRVSSALQRAGLVSTMGPAAARDAVVLEVVGLTRYEAFEAVVAALRDQLGATQVETLLFERKRQLLSVRGPFDEAQLSSRLARYHNPKLVLEPLGVDPVSGRIRVLGRWFSEMDSAESQP